MPRRTEDLKIRRRNRKNAARGVEPTRLLFHPVIQPGEGAAAFLFRVARRNGTTLSKLKQLGIAFDPAIFDVALSWDRIRPSPEAQQYVERLTGLLESAPRAWATTSPRCCSQCLREQQYWSAEWELRQYLACTKHKCWLMDRCGVCNERISWNRAALHRCDCGAGFVDAAPTPAPPEYVELSALIGSKLRKQFSAAAPFDALSLKATSDLIIWITRLNASGIVNSPVAIGLLDDMQTAIPVLKLAAGVFAAWPSGYLAYLRSVHQDRGDASASVADSFAGIYKYISKNRNVDGFGPMVEHFQQYLIDQWSWPILERGNDLLDSISSRLDWIWAANAARLLNIKEGKVREFVNQGLIQSKAWPLTKNRVLTAIRRGELSRMRQLLDDQATSRALRSLGVSVRRQLVLVPLLFPEAEYKHGGGGWNVSKARVREILAIADGRPIVDIESNTQIALARVLRSCAWRNEMVERLFRLILDREVRVEAILRDRSGFTGWLFDRNVLARVQKGDLTANE